MTIVPAKEPDANHKVFTDLPAYLSRYFVRQRPAQIPVERRIWTTKDAQQLPNLRRLRLSVPINVLPLKDLSAQRRRVPKIKILTRQLLPVAREAASQSSSNDWYAHDKAHARLDRGPIDPVSGRLGMT